MKIKRINPEAELRDGFLVSEKRKSIWNVEFELLQIVLDVCQKNKLTIWLCGGSALGAVRHHGFIPWDDDMDLLMPRKDYDKLQAIAQKEFKAPYFFQSSYTDKNYWKYFSRLRKSDTTAINVRDVFKEINQGIFIDIFPCDSVDENKAVSVNKLWEAIRQKDYLSCNKFRVPLNRDIGIFLRSYFPAKVKFLFKTRMESFIKAENILRYLSEAPSGKCGEMSIGRSSIRLYDRSVYPKDVFKETIFMDFEGLDVPLMSGFDEYLRIRYGDYMKPVQSPALHSGQLFDPKKPYTYYLPSLRKEHGFVKDLVRIIKKKVFHLNVEPLFEEELMKL